VAVISGGAWTQFEKQLLTDLPQGSLPREFVSASNLWNEILSIQRKVDGALFRGSYSGAKKKIIDSLNKAAEEAGYHAEKVWGKVIEDRGSQVTFSALGQQAPLAEKEKWDPDFAKRKKITAILETLIPEFSIRMGGATSIDVTKPGIDKAYGIGKLRDTLHLSLKEMVYIGDALFPGGNDYPAEEAGVVSIPVKGPGRYQPGHQDYPCLPG
jgi:phosphomannomutase